MQQSTYSPAFTAGSRVQDIGTDRLGTVAEDPEMALEYPGMVPVQWDDGARTLAAPSILEPVEVPTRPLSEYATGEVVAEAKRRGLPIPKGLEAPEGFTIETIDGEETTHTGPEIERPGYTILTNWTPEDGVLLFIDHAQDEAFTVAEVRDLLETLPNLLRRFGASL